MSLLCNNFAMKESTTFSLLRWQIGELSKSPYGTIKVDCWVTAYKRTHVPLMFGNMSLLRSIIVPLFGQRYRRYCCHLVPGLGLDKLLKQEEWDVGDFVTCVPTCTDKTFRAVGNDSIDGCQMDHFDLSHNFLGPMFFGACLIATLPSNIFVI